MGQIVSRITIALGIGLSSGGTPVSPIPPGTLLATISGLYIITTTGIYIEVV